LYRFDGEPGDQYGFSIADAGDTNRDGVHDILVGAPGNGAGHVDLYSGRTGEPIRTLTGDVVGDQFGSGAGWSRDVNGDHVPDQILGARNAGPEQRGKAYVYSGKTGGRLFAIDASPHGGQFGSFFVAGVGDVNGDKTPDF